MLWINLQKIANKEITRTKEVENRLEYISRQLGQLDIIKNLPESQLLSDELIDCAMDVRSSTLTYIAVHIRRAATHFGIVGGSLSLCLSFSS